MRLLGVVVLLMGMIMFASGLIFLDLSSMVLKDDLYTLSVLGFFNNLFSMHKPTAMFQSTLSLIFILMGCFITFGGGILMRTKR